MFEIKWIDCIKITKGEGAKFNYMIPIYGLFFKGDYNASNLYSELYYRNKAKHSYADIEENKFESINYDE